MVIATLFYNPTVEELNAQASLTAAAVAFAVTLGWLVFARVTRKQGAPLKLPTLFWIFAGASVALLGLGVAGTILAHAAEEQELKQMTHELRERDSRKAP